MAGRGAGLSDWEWCVCEDIFPLLVRLRVE